jgi:threonine synthase
MKYGIFADKPTGQAYAAAKKRREMTEEDEAAVVLVMRDHPAFSSEFIRHTIGEAPEMPENIKEVLKPTTLNRKMMKTAEEVIEIFQSL